MSLDLRRNTPLDFVCKWTGCTEREYPLLAALVTHVSNEHLALITPAAPNEPVRYSCQWEGCLRYYVEQPSRFALISHCRTHTGEKPYFCPIPECEKHFTRSDALAKHVKGVHDLHQHRDAVGLMRYRSDTGKFDLPLDIDVQRLTDDQYARLLQQDYLLRVPWWFLEGFASVVQSETHKLEALLSQHLDTRQHDVARLRYKKFLLDRKGEDLILTNEVKRNSNLLPLQGETQYLRETFEEAARPLFRKLPSSQKTFEELQATLATATKINRVVKKNLDAAVREKRRLYVLKEALLEANVRLGLVTENTGIRADALDEVLLKEGIEDAES